MGRSLAVPFVVRVNAMRTATFPPYASNSAFVQMWPFSRPTHSIPTPLPSCPELVKALCPLKGYVSNALLPELTWNQVKGLCQ